MVVKIAYCAAISLFGLDSFEKRFVLTTLLGKKDDVGFWMGCDPKGSIIPLIGKQRYRNVIKVGIWNKAGNKMQYVITRLKFFASSDAPEYIVVLGTAVYKPMTKNEFEQVEKRRKETQDR